MLLYLFTLQKEGKAHFGHDIDRRGCCMLPARDEILTAERNITPEKRGGRAGKATESGPVCCWRTRRCWRPWNTTRFGSPAICPCG